MRLPPQSELQDPASRAPARGRPAPQRLASAVGNRRMGQVLARKKKAPPPPVAGGNILYVGMNNYKPEIARLRALYKGSSVTVTGVTVTDAEAKTVVGTDTFDLTTPKGIDAWAASLGLAKPVTDQLRKLMTDAKSEDRDDLAHLVAVYAACEADGKDRMSRVVLSGHSYGTKIYNEDIKGAIWFDALIKLAAIFPKAAGQTKHLILLACLAGAEDLVKNVYRKAFPNLRTWWGWTSSCPTGWGAVKALESWTKTTDANPSKLDLPPAGQANWATGLYQSGDETIDAPALMSGLRADEATFQKYFAGTKVDPDNHSGFLFEFYRRARSASQHTSAITGADHDHAQLRADQSFRLRFWPAMVSNFWKKHQAVIAKGYGKAKVPNFGRMTRKEALAAIAAFPAATDATAADRDPALLLLNKLKDLDPVELNDNWLTP